MATSRSPCLLAVVMLIGVVPAGGQQVSKPATRDRRVITLEEIEQAQETNAFEIVQKLRPEFLRRMSEHHNFTGGTAGSGVGGRANAGGAGDSTSGTAVGRAAGNDAMGQQFSGDNREDARPEGGVFVEGTEIGGIDELRQIPASTVEWIRYISASDVDMRYGQRFPNGVIEVKLKTH